jgi:molybdopterin-guanine dinucleotide biosynthesis protein A
MTRSDHLCLPAIVIAAGGEGQRIGGHKPLRMLGGRSLLAHAVENAALQSDCVALAVREPGQIEAGGLPMLFDADAGHGPICALASAFAFAADRGRAQVMLIGCDQPFLPRDLAAKLGAALGHHKVAMPVSRGKYQPLAALWRPDAAALADYIADGGQSLWRFAEAQGVVHVEWPAAGPVDPFANINDPAGLAAAEHHFSTPAQTPAR